MSLDLYIISPEPVKNVTTGVFYRKDGKTLECKTLDQVKYAFPDMDVSNVNVYEYETDEFWHGNLTHNLAEMARQVKLDGYTLYDMMWQPDKHGIINVTYEYVDRVNRMVDILGELDETVIKNTTPENGWGTYDQLLCVASEFAEQLMNLYNFEDNYEDYKIVSDT